MITEPITRETPFGSVTFAPLRPCDIEAIEAWALTSEGISILADVRKQAAIDRMALEDWSPRPETWFDKFVAWVLSLIRKP